MKKIRIASVTLLIFNRVKIFIVLDSFNSVCKFHFDHSNLSESQKSELRQVVCDFVDSCDGVGKTDLFPIEFSEVSKAEIFSYLSKKFC